MGRRERRAAELAKRREEKKGRRELGRPVSLRLGRSRAAYAEAWAREAARLAAAGHYAWMARLVGDSPGSVVDVGVGTGEGAAALVQAGWAVLGVDENVACLATAGALLSCEAELRGSARVAAPDVYEVDYRKPVLDDRAKVRLVEGDVLADPGLWSALEAAGPFDALTCWLPGTHDARWSERRMRQLVVGDEGAYRLLVEDAVYDRAGSLLRPGGILSIVERVAGPFTEALASAAVRAHRENAAGASLDFERLDSRPDAGGTFVAVRARRRPS
jgi:SAM-dependent methyltransferase